MYSVSLLSELLPTTSALLSVAVSAVNLIMSLLCAPLIDKLGRKPCLLISIAGMGLNSLLLAFSIIYSIPVLSAIATVLFVASFAVGLGPVPFLLAAELVGHEAVGATQSWALGSSWISTFLVAQFFPVLNLAMGAGQVYFIFAALAAGFFAFIAWWIPETAGKTSVEEIWGKQD
jgi:MFS family permease